MADKKIIYELNESERIDKYLACTMPDYTRTQIQQWIIDGYVMVNEKFVKPSYQLKLGDVIEVRIPDPVPSELKKQNIPLDIYYEDDDVIVINKPSGMVVHPATGNFENTLVNALLYHCETLSEIKGPARAGIVHRLDKDTSGLLVACKTNYAHRKLAKQFANRTITREYIAIVHGVIPHNFGRINAPIGRDPKDRKKMAVVEDGKEAITNFTVLERFDDFTLISCKLETGRTHQIRVHMAYIGYPVVGDFVYGPRKVVGRMGQFLHAAKLGFHHPRTQEYLEFNAPLPDYFQEFLQKISNTNS